MAELNLAISGHGEVGKIPIFDDSKSIKYRNLIFYIINNCQRHSKNIFNGDQAQKHEITKLIKWQQIILIDTCYSGSCIDEAKDWARNNEKVIVE